MGVQLFLTLFESSFIKYHFVNVMNDKFSLYLYFDKLPLLRLSYSHSLKKSLNL